MELDGIIYQKDKMEISAQKLQKTEFKHVGSMRFIPGCILWEFHLSTFKLQPAKMDIQISIDTQGTEVRKRKIFYDPRCWYFFAHCQRAAVKKANKFIFKHTGIKEMLMIKPNGNKRIEKNTGAEEGTGNPID